MVSRRIRKALLLRSLTRHYPTRRGTGVLAPAIDAIARGRLPDSALSSERAVAPRGRWNPDLALDLDHAFQRQIFYFTPAFGHGYLSGGGPAVLARFLAPGGTFVDIGASLGFYTFLAARRVGANGRVHAFEPEPVAYDSLRASAALPGHECVRCHPLALSDAPAAAMTFHLSTVGNSHSLVSEAPGHSGRYRAAIQVEVETIDRLRRSRRLAADRVDLVKIDVEGNEAAVVAGMTETLETWRKPPLYIETRGPEGSTRSPDTFRRLLEILEPRGYRSYLVDRRGASRPVSVGKVRTWADVLFATEPPSSGSSAPR